MIAGWSNGDVDTIVFKGNKKHLDSFLSTLVKDFNEPKFGYTGELFDEDEDDDLLDRDLDDLDEVDMDDDV